MRSDTSNPIREFGLLGSATYNNIAHGYGGSHLGWRSRVGVIPEVDRVMSSHVLDLAFSYASPSRSQWTLALRIISLRHANGDLTYKLDLFRKPYLAAAF